MTRDPQTKISDEQDKLREKNVGSLCGMKGGSDLRKNYKGYEHAERDLGVSSDKYPSPLGAQRGGRQNRMLSLKVKEVQAAVFCRLTFFTKMSVFCTTLFGPL